MRRLWSGFFVFGFIASSVRGNDRQEELFKSWQEAQRSVKSLVVQFTLVTWDSVYEERLEAEGIFRLLCTPTGQVFASYDVTPKAKRDSELKCSALLNNGKIYLLRHDERTAIQFDATKGDLLGFLGKYFNPFVLFLDRKRAEEKFKIEVAKVDEWHTYLSLKSKKIKKTGWFPDPVREARAVLMNKTTEGVPQNMPRQLWYTDGYHKYDFDIKSWHLNAADPPKLEDFAKPEDRPGWQVRP